MEKDGNISIESSRLPINSPKVDDVVIGQVTRLNENVAEIRILHIESKQEATGIFPRSSYSLTFTSPRSWIDSSHPLEMQ